MLPSAGTRGSENKLEHRRFHLIRKQFFTVWMAEHWHKLPRGCEISSLEISKSCLDVVLGNLLMVSLPEQGLEQMTSRSLFPTSTVMCFSEGQSSLFCIMWIKDTCSVLGFNCFVLYHMLL